jgi:hypothetical protein
MWVIIISVCYSRFTLVFNMEFNLLVLLPFHPKSSPCELINVNLVMQQNLIMKFCSHDCGSSSHVSKLEACKLVIVTLLFFI